MPRAGIPLFGLSQTYKVKPMVNAHAELGRGVQLHDASAAPGDDAANLPGETLKG
jgi:hypothetical protein